MLIVATGRGADPLDQWTLRLNSTNASSQVAFAGGRYFALGLATYYDSTNAIAWQFHEVPGAIEGGFPLYLNAVAFGEGRFVMVGGEAGVSGTGTLLTTTDPSAPQWQRPESWTDTAPLVAVERQNGVFVAVGGSVVTGARIAVSADGVTWADRSPSVQTALRDVAYGNGRWVAVGGLQNGAPAGGTILSSTNALEWTTYVLDSVPGGRNGGYILNGVTFGNGQFLATGYGDRLFPIFASSPDGTVWSAGSGQFNGSGWDVAFGDGLFVAAGNGMVTSLANGPLWSPHTPVDLRGNLVFANHTFLSVGSGKIWQSADVRPRILSASAAAPSQIRLQAEAVISTSLALEVSTDREHWTVQKDWIATNATSEVSLPVSASTPLQLIRLRSP